EAEAPKSALGASLGLHAVLLTVLIVIPLLAPQALHVNYRTLFVTPPPPRPPVRTEVVHLKLPPPPKPNPPQPDLVVEKLVAPPPKVAVRNDVHIPDLPKPAP